MNIDRAIEILTKWEEPESDEEVEELDCAITLGIEALKQIQKDRQGTFSIPLPEETIEKVNE